MIVGGAGFDVVDYSASASAGMNIYMDGSYGTGGDAAGDRLFNVEEVIGSNQDDRITGNDNGDLILGGAGNDSLTGGAGADTLQGGTGNDVIITGLGADQVDGGAGFDIVDYRLSNAGVRIANDGTAGVGGWAQGDTLQNVEQIEGSAFADTLSGAPTTGTVLNGWGGNDSFVSGAAADTIDGGLGIDSIDYSASAAGVNVHLDGSVSSGGDAAGGRPLLRC